MSPEQIAYIDEVAKLAMSAIIAKHPPLSHDGSTDDIHDKTNVWNRVSMGAHMYAIGMLKAREHFGLFLDDEESEETEPEKEAKPEPKLFLHGRPVYDDTILLYINDYACETFEDDGIEVTFNSEDSYEEETVGYFLLLGEEWHKWYIVKPEVFLHGKPVYADTVLLGRRNREDAFAIEVMAGEADPHFDGINSLRHFVSSPINLLKEDTTWDQFYKVKDIE